MTNALANPLSLFEVSGKVAIVTGAFGALGRSGGIYAVSRLARLRFLHRSRALCRYGGLI
jgi:hypothetical protein